MIEVNIPTGERSYLYSSRSNWYPQPSDLRLRDGPDPHHACRRGLACVATGEIEGPPVMLPPQAGAPPRRQFEFVASRPVRYLAFIASRFARADRVTVAFDEVRDRRRQAGATRRSRRRRPRCRARFTRA